MKTHRLFLPLAVLTSPVLPGSSALIHRWSFNEAAGSAADGASLVDSVGGATGFVRGDGANFTGTGLDLPGGDSMNGRAAYGDLPNNLISVHSTVTLEGWVSVGSSGGGGWTRIFDFGSTQGAPAAGEITGPGNTNGGGTDGRDYLMLSASRGGNYNQQRIEWRNEDPGGGGNTTLDSNLNTTFGEIFHFAVSIEGDGSQSVVNYWRNGVHVTVDGISPRTLGDINDVNNWLGRSTWINDGTLDGTFEEFRIWDNAADQSFVDASIALGADSVIPEPAVFSLLGLTGFALLLRRRRSQ